MTEGKTEKSWLRFWPHESALWHVIFLVLIAKAFVTRAELDPRLERIEAGVDRITDHLLKKSP